MLKYDPTWMFAVLQDLMEFAEENDLPETHEAIARLIETSQAECKAKNGPDQFASD